MAYGAETELESMIVRLIGDGSPYQKMIEQAETSTKQAATTIEAATKKIEGFGTGLKTFAASAVSALSSLGLMSWLKSAFEGSEKLESAQLRLSAAIEASGRSVEPTLGQYRDFAKAVSEQTNVTKGSVMAMLQEAETRNLQGDAAKGAVTNSIAFAAALGGEAQSHMHLAIALEQGNTHMLRRALGLRNVKDESEVLARAQQVLASGLKVAEAESETAGAQMKKLEHDLSEVKSQFGKVIEEALKPIIPQIREVVGWFMKLDEGTKKTVVMVAAIGAGLLMIGPAFGVLSTLLGPVIAIFTTVLPAAFGFLLSPIGLVVAAVVALGAAILYWTDLGNDALDWFTKQWQRLVDYVKPAIDGIKNAIKAGNLSLAFQIAWTQIKLTFAEATVWLREQWIKFVTGLKVIWAEITAWIQKTWTNATTGIGKGMVDIFPAMQDMLNSISAGAGDRLMKALGFDKDLMNVLRNQGDEVKGILNDMAAKAHAKIEEERVAAIQAAFAGEEAKLKALKKNIEDLKAEREKLLKQAADEAAKVPPPPIPAKLEPHMPKLPTQTIRARVKIDAVEFTTAEALARVMSSRAGGEASKFSQAKGGIEAQNKPDANTPLLVSIRDTLIEESKKPTVNIKPAAFG